MRVVVLGSGLQGRAALYDLVRHQGLTAVVAADRELQPVRDFCQAHDLMDAVDCVQLDAEDPKQVARLVAQGFDVVVDLLPVPLHDPVTAAAVDCGVHLVNSSYVSPVMERLAQPAARRGVAMLPELGLDPGIDLVLLGEAARRLDRVESIRSYGAGFPDRAAAADSPISYKVTWNLEGVLRSYHRPGRLIRSSEMVTIPADRIFADEHCHEVEIEGVGRLEAFANGDAVHYATALGLELEGLAEVGRYVLRWPGHCSFWKKMVDLHLLDDEPLLVDGRAVDRRAVLAAALEPHMRYRDDERDVAVVRVEVGGTRNGRPAREVLQVIDRRDLSTGLFAMNRMVGFAAAIGAGMLGSGVIRDRGLLSPLHHIPFEPFVAELERRGIHVSATQH
jgi:saccharopine dehydrogenase-like NADP-dependent oxidoreductase